jgi:hypothetical protein
VRARRSPAHAGDTATATAERMRAGFKFIGNTALDLTARGFTVPFGYEEAIGFMFGDELRDKDGVAATVRSRMRRARVLPDDAAGPRSRSPSSLRISTARARPCRAICRTCTRGKILHRHAPSTC